MTSSAISEITRAVKAFAGEHLDDPQVCVGLSGGPDSTALTAAAVRAGLDVRALIVDHRLQPGSAEVAGKAAAVAEALGARPVVVGVDVTGGGGPEAAARRARYAAFESHRADRPVLLGHTLDDQAETVLLGFARGSGARSVAGMRPWAPPFGRPLLDVRRSATVAACAELDVTPYEDPHNRDPRFTRVRLRREVMPLLDEVLSGGVAEALARTARHLQLDLDVVERMVDDHAALVDTEQVDCDDLAVLPGAIRLRLLRRWLLAKGATEPTEPVVQAVDALVMRWRGQGAVAIGGRPQFRTQVTRRGARLVVERRNR
ncbi:UNVERIFIED_CONTAM: tRNA(Ile)-lysidine synthase [Williamsia faeni]